MEHDQGPFDETVLEVLGLEADGIRWNLRMSPDGTKWKKAISAKKGEKGHERLKGVFRRLGDTAC